MKNDIKNIDDIKLMVDTFYGKIREDEKLTRIIHKPNRNTNLVVIKIDSSVNCREADPLNCRKLTPLIAAS